MYYILGEKSKEKLKGVHPQLVKLMTEAVKESPYDFRIYVKKPLDRLLL